MKTTKFPILALSLMLAFFCSTNGNLRAQSPSEAVKYMNDLEGNFKNISSDAWDYISAASHGKSARKVENRRKDILKTIAAAKKEISVMPGYYGDNSMRDSVMAYLTLYYYVLDKDFGKIVDMEEIAEQSYDNMEAYLLAQEKADEKLDTANSNLDKMELAFAQQHNYTVTKNNDDISKKLEVSDKVYKYYNVIYLIQFKSSKQEAYLLEAISKGDVNGMEQNKNALQKNSEEGLDKLGSVKSYSGDMSIVSSCKAALAFFKNEASDKMKEVIDFYIAKENFEKIKAAFEAKSKSSRTNADVEQYNKAGADYNNVINKYNTLTQELNKKRSEVYEAWNKSVESFLDRQVPKRK